MKHYGDITKLNGADLPIVDVVCGGSPCQDLSVAGKRAGLDGARSGLFMEQIRVIKEMRDECIRQLSMRGADIDIRHIRPRFLVWENVPGALSSGSEKGADFRCVLEEVCRIADKTATVPMPEKGKWSTSGCIMGENEFGQVYSVCWRIHDAQFWGVPQRRKRISLVADFGGASAPEILFERKGLSGDFEQSEQTGEGTSEVVRGNLNSSGERVRYNNGNRTDDIRERNPEIITFQERAGKSGGQRNPHTTRTNRSLVNRQQSALIASGGGQVNDAVSPSEEVSKTLNCMDDPMKIITTYGLDRASFNQGKNALYNFSVEEETAQTLVSKGPGGGY